MRDGYLGKIRAAWQGRIQHPWKIDGQIGGEAGGERTRRRVFRAAPSLPGGWIHGEGIGKRIQAVRKFRPRFRRGRRKQHAAARAVAGEWRTRVFLDRRLQGGVEMGSVCKS